MGEIHRLELRETIRLDTTRFWLLEQSLGPVVAEERANTALETIVERICAIEAAWRAAEFQRLAKSARLLVGVAEEVGMVSLVGVARDVARLATFGDDAALAATVARLTRTGEASLAALWEVNHSHL